MSSFVKRDIPRFVSDYLYTKTGLKFLKIADTASGVNYPLITTAATGNAVQVSAEGSDTNVGLDLSSKGTGAVKLWTGAKAREALILANTASAVNEITITQAATTSAPSIAATGDDTDIGLTLATKGLGVYKVLANGVNRAVYNPTAKTIVDGSATSLFSVAATAGQYAAGMMDFVVFASDGTDHQALTGRAAYAAVNKAGTLTRTITYTTAPEAKAVSSGTLTLAFTTTDDTNVMTVKLQPTGSLTETTYTILYTLLPLQGTVTIL